MRAKHNGAHGYYTLIQTKITPADKLKLCAIAESFNMSVYMLVQALLLGIVRYFDKDTAISPERSTMLDAFFNVITATAGSFSPLSLKGYRQQTVKSAILFVQRKEGQQPKAMAIGKDEQGNITETYNADKMLADYLQATDPKTLKLLEDERKRMGLFSIGHTLHQLVLLQSAQQGEKMCEEIKTMFDDVRIPSGLAINTEVFYRRKHDRGDYSQTTSAPQTYRADL